MEKNHTVWVILLGTFLLFLVCAFAFSLGRDIAKAEEETVSPSVEVLS